MTTRWDSEGASYRVYDNEGVYRGRIWSLEHRWYAGVRDCGIFGPLKTREAAIAAVEQASPA